MSGRVIVLRTKGGLYEIGEHGHWRKVCKLDPESPTRAGIGNRVYRLAVVPPGARSLLDLVTISRDQLAPGQIICFDAPYEWSLTSEVVSERVDAIDGPGAHLLWTEDAAWLLREGQAVPFLSHGDNGNQIAAESLPEQAAIVRLDQDTAA